MQFTTQEKNVKIIKERDVCRIIIDRNEVLASKISELIVAELGGDLDTGRLREVISKIKAETVMTTDTTVDAVIKLFAK